MHRIYLDANGSCPPIPEALHKVRESLSLFGNPSSFHEHGRIMRAHIDEARLHLAQALNARAKELIFCSGASEANRLFIDALVLEARKKNEALRIVISPFEHPSLLKPALAAQDDGYFSLTILELSPTGQLLFEQSALLACDVLICCQAHNETGIVPPLDQLLALVGPDALVMSDVSQGLARLEPLPARVDVLTFSAQKMGGLPGMGGIVMRGRARRLAAPWPGGGQEGGFRPGTEASLLIMAAGEAAKHVARQRTLNQSLAAKRAYLEERLWARGTIKIIGQHQPRLANTSAMCFLSHPDPDALRIACDMAGLSVGFGAACSGLAPVGSFALSRMGLSLQEQKSCVRFSLPPEISHADIEQALERLQSSVLRKNTGK